MAQTSFRECLFFVSCEDQQEAERMGASVGLFRFCVLIAVKMRGEISERKNQLS